MYAVLRATRFAVRSWAMSSTKPPPEPGFPPIHGCSPDASGGALIDWGVVGVAVNDLPLSVLAAVDVGEAQRARFGRPTVDGHMIAFSATSTSKL